MNDFTYASYEDAVKLIKGNVTGWREEYLKSTLVNVSVRLSAWYPGLQKRWSELPDDSELKQLVSVMVAEAARKIVSNPDGVSSETMGPYAYSKFDSEDPSKGLFYTNDIKALEELLNAETSKQASSFRVNRDMLPAAPMPRPGIYTNRYRWKRF